MDKTHQSPNRWTGRGHGTPQGTPQGTETPILHSVGGHGCKNQGVDAGWPARARPPGGVTGPSCRSGGRDDISQQPPRTSLARGSLRWGYREGAWREIRTRGARRRRRRATSRARATSPPTSPYNERRCPRCRTRLLGSARRRSLPGLCSLFHAIVSQTRGYTSRTSQWHSSGSVRGAGLLRNWGKGFHSAHKSTRRQQRLQPGKRDD